MSSSLSHDDPEFWISLGQTLLCYRLDPTGAVELLILPGACRDQVCDRQFNRPTHPFLKAPGQGVAQQEKLADSLVQVAIRGLSGPGNWVAGGTMRNQEASRSLRFVGQKVSRSDRGILVETILRSHHGFEVAHEVDWREGDLGMIVRTRLVNTGERALTLEMLSSFSLSGISPFAPDDAPNRLRLHRFRSAWSAEGRHDVRSFESAHLERTWGGGPVFLRFGQTGSLPVRRFFPFVGVEDCPAGVLWGAQTVWQGSWQMEVYRRGDEVAMSGGHGDFELAQWAKTVAPGECFEAPPALVSTVKGDLDSLCQSLVELQTRLAHPEPKHERDLPIIFNEWCSTWGKPTHDYVLRTADRLAETPVRYLVIDDGWAEKPEGADIQFNGDWKVNERAFPGGLKTTTAGVRERGLIPGIWFEFEPCTEGTEAFSMTDHQLRRHGAVIQVGNRHFWDFRDPWTFDYLTRRVIDLLRDNDFGYLKVDYNESIGVGCDGAESLGEGLRQHLVQVKAFFEKIRREVPGIVIENCASGGHRLEPGMVALTSMSSFSDAHETVEIPIIAANLHRLIPVHKNQVWAVLRVGDSYQRLCYSLAATFLGRMCVSGDVVQLPDEHFSLFKKAAAFYENAVPVLRDGRTRIFREMGASMRYPTGWQAVIRSKGQTSLVVTHSFEHGLDREVEIRLPGENRSWRVTQSFGAVEAVIRDGMLVLPPMPDFTGAAWLIGP